MDTQEQAPANVTPGDVQSLRHELRTPVNHIIGFSEMLLEELGETGSFSALREVVAEGRVMLAIIGEQLDGTEAGASADGLASLHEQLAPHLQRVVRICDELATLAEREGPAVSVPDLLKIAGAAAHLGDLTAGTAGPKAPAGGADGPAVATPLPSSAVPGSHAASGAAPAAGGTILIVDDNEMNRDILARRLERLGYEPYQAADGRTALELLRLRPFDLVLLDMMMPELDGFAVLQAMKAEPELQRVSVIVLSALDDMESVVRAVDLGADDYLPKPFDPVLLKARIGACLFKKGLRDLEVEYLRQIQDEKRRADRLLNVVIPIGVALTVEKDFNHLLETIVGQAQELTRAEGGTLYLRTDDDKLRFMIVRNETLKIAMGGASGKDIPFPPLRLYAEETGEPLLNYVVTHAALEGKTINIADAYDTEGYDFSGTREFDARTRYRTTSVLNIPLRDGLGRIIGVLQLINARDEQDAVIPFDTVAEQMIQSLGSLAAAALAAYMREQTLRQEISNLKIEIDQVKKQREVEEITNTPYFVSLQERAKAIRRGERVSVEADRRVVTRNVYTVDGQKIVVREQGPGRGRLLLMIHGWSSSWYALSPLMTLLNDRYRCVAVDLPGYGESPPLRGPTSIPVYADLMAGLIQQLSPGLPAIVVGHSMGGMTALTMALHHRDLLERMVLLCPTISGRLSFWINAFISPITMAERSRLASGLLSVVEPYTLSLTDRLMRPASFAERTGISEADYHRLRADARRPGQGRVRAECFLAMRENNLEGKIAAIDVPALVIWGMEDNTVPLRDASLVAEKWPSAELRVLPKAGHWPQFETPEATGRAVRSFLSTPVKLLKAWI